MSGAVPATAPAGWADYFPPKEYARDDRRALLIHDLVGFFFSGGGHTFVEGLQPYGDNGYTLQVDFASLESQSGLPDLPAALEGSPMEALGCMAVAAYEAAFTHRLGRLLYGTHTSAAAPGGSTSGGGDTSSGGGPSGPDARPPPGPTLPPGRITIRLVNHPASEIHIRQLKSSSIGKLVTLRGTVVRMTPVRPLVTGLDFVCAKCGTSTAVNLTDGVYVTPTKCAGEGCRSRTFTPHRASARCTDWRKIRLQELLGSDKAAEGQVPRSVEVEVTGELVHGAMVGDVVTVMGLVKVIATGEKLGSFASTGSAAGGGGGGRHRGGGRGGGGGGGGRGGGGGGGSSLFLLYLEAVSLICPRSLPGGAGGMQAPSLGEPLGGSLAPGGLPAFITKDLAFVVKFCETCGGDQLRQLVHALCPSIYGQELVKCGLVLALLGGVRQGGSGGAAVDEGVGGGAGDGAGGGGGVTDSSVPAPGSGSGSGGDVPVRGDIHVLLVGDPGLGKSQLLKATASAAPRGLYVCGTSATSAGLTVSVVRDALTGDATLEAGAVVLADCGVCCVDEFDKMTGEHQSLLDVMEQQQVSVAKAGLVANLPARASLIAAANPVGGHYQRAKSLAENLRALSPALLSRFDLVFVLLDTPDSARDTALSEHVMALHSGLPERAQAARQRLLQFGTQSGAPALLTAGPSSSTLSGSQQYSQQSGGGGASGWGGGSRGPGGGAGGGGGGGRPPLSQRLKLASTDENTQLPVALMRKYISYARTYCHPRLSEGAKQVIQSFYMQIRAQAAPGSKNPVTARQLESLVRLAEARARAELRPVVETSDAEDVVDLVREALYDRFGGDLGLGCTDYRQAGGGRSGSRNAETSRFLSHLRRVAQREGRAVFSAVELSSIANEIALGVRDFEGLLRQLNESGELLKRGPGQYKVGGVPEGPAPTQNNGSVC